MKLLGIASAVHGLDGLKLTTSVVGGDSKDNIVLLDRNSRDLDPNSPKSVYEVFGEYLHRISEVVTQQRIEVVSAVPVVFGWPADLDLPQMVDHLSAQFTRYMLKDDKDKKYKRRKENETFQEKMVRSKAQMHKVKVLIEGYARANSQITREGIKFLPRGFRNFSRELPEEEVRSVIERIDPEWEQKFRTLKERAQTRSSAREGLKTEVRKIALDFVRFYFSQVSREDETRFFMTGAPSIPQMVQSERHNCFYGDEELRQIFAEVIIKVSQIDYNIALKCPRDPSSPQFSDVAATYVADNLDQLQHSSIKPQAVRVRTE